MFAEEENVTPRLLKRAQVMALLQVSSSTLARWIDQGIVPPPLAGTSRWDRLEIERALDATAGSAQPRPPTLSERASTWARSR